MALAIAEDGPAVHVERSASCPLPSCNDTNGIPEEIEFQSGPV